MYYVYLHKNSVTNQPFYVGSGVIGRVYNFYSRPDYWKEYVSVNGEPIVEIVASVQTKLESLQIEVETIKKYKRICDGGILLNKSVGGIGPTGYNQSNEAKIRIGIAHKNKKLSIETKDKTSKSLKKYFESIESRIKLSIGIKRSALFQEKMKIVNYGKRKIILDTQTGIYYTGLEEAANSRGMNKVTLGCKLNGADNNNTSFIYV